MFYSECGKIGTSRRPSIRDDQNRLLKEWKFANALGDHATMTVSAKDISARGNIGLYYTSKEVITPRKLVSLVVVNPSSASR